MKKLIKATKETGIKQVAIAGGVSANSGLQKAMHENGKRYGWEVFIPKFKFSTDNAAMIGIAGYFKYKRGMFATQDQTPYARTTTQK
jgi:N6-L-threonylcarbamoyladenine synthase